MRARVSRCWWRRWHWGPPAATTRLRLRSRRPRALPRPLRQSRRPRRPPEAGAAAPITLTVVGDLMLVRGVPDAAAALAPLGRRLASADITVGNLESTLSLNGSPRPNGDSFGGTPALLQPAARAGFDALSLANNHTGDYGSTALVETMRGVRRLGDRGLRRRGGPEGGERPVIIESRRGAVRVRRASTRSARHRRPRRGEPGALSVRMPPRTGPLMPADLDHVASRRPRAALQRRRRRRAAALGHAVHAHARADPAHGRPAAGGAPART